MNKNKKVYVEGISQISIQNPLVDEWMYSPLFYKDAYVRAIDPNFKEYLSPLESRRMGKILKRAVVTSLDVLKKSEIEVPGAIITGTGLGCIENTELFLDALCREGEDLLKPTHFMQSTHNTISSLIGIYAKAHCYNTTYAHKSISFDSALQDAWVQFQLNLVGSALVGGYDEMTPSYFQLLKKIGFVGQGKEVCGEVAASVLLNEKANDAWCLFSGIKLMYCPDLAQLKENIRQLLASAGLQMQDIGAIMTGISGNKINDAYYKKYLRCLFNEDIPLLQYKSVFGEIYTASGLGFYAAACCLKHGFVPDFLYLDENQPRVHKPNAILLFTISEGKNFSCILLESACGK